MQTDQLTRQAIRAGVRASRKAGHPLTREEILRLRVQTISPWKRLVFVIIGCGLGVLAYMWSQNETQAWIWIITALAAIGTILFGIFGRHETIDRQFQSLKEAGPDQILDVVTEAITSAFDGL